MVVEKEDTFEVEGKHLYTKSWLPDGPPKAKLVFIHGFSDHVNRYNRMMTALANRGIAVYGFDQRGWGRSVSGTHENGLTGPTSRVIADIAAFIKSHLPADDSVPVFVLGHSMGGQQVLTLASSVEYHDEVVRRVRGWLLESPLIDVSPETKPSVIKVLAGRLLGRVLPRRQMFIELRPHELSRDPAIQKDLEEDKLMHNTGTLEGLAGMMDRMEMLATGAVRPTGKAVRSLWFGHGTQDKVTCYNASKNYFEKFTNAVEDKEFKTYEGWYHQLHADGECSDEFYNDMADWILARCGTEGKESKL
ncbi:Alpha/Beta hydrolase protein [Podospora aff. communis PSN243]|uniref:Alpha/Beta hydrolase protein n=1 Tax=Podospora aff. communis PSN243 TaxID=3040156 RepID=A0AAV9H0V6_9PEZI|nr:Alpha/Beta hydrolase protein [Podospora aff. communis PSN243]